MKKMQEKEGFTLLELLWVIVIIGFITAMVAPRLGGVSQRSAGKINDANLKDMKKYVEAYQQENAGDFPGSMINPVLASDDGITHASLASMEDRTNDAAESISSGFATRCLLAKHVLNAAEATELQDIGITRVLSWNHPDDPDYSFATHENRYDPVDVASGVVVGMIGGGSSDASSNITPDAAFNDVETTIDIDKIGNPEWLYRIIVGIGPDCSLVTDGTLEAAPLCPDGINSNHYLYNYYSLVLPRLSATVSRIGTTFDDDDGDGSLDFDVIDAADTAGGQIKRIQLDAMTSAEFDSVDATGHGRQEDVSYWQLYDDGDGL